MAGSSFPRRQKTHVVKQAGAWSAAAKATTTQGAATTQVELAARWKGFQNVLEYQNSNDNDDEFCSHPHQQQIEHAQPSQFHSPKQWFMRRCVRAA
jgi:hypothetical protein